jgi:signal transduction histidine kinase
VTLTAERGPGRLTLAVADTGTGVPPDMAEHLFEPFVTGRPEGTGLGLAIARELSDAHHGRLGLRSAGNGSGGAVFVLELPQAEGALPPEHK